MNGLDVKRSMECLKRFHDKKLAVGHTFDLFGQIEKYELLREIQNLSMQTMKKQRGMFTG